jgi:hypothetical protein
MKHISTEIVNITPKQAKAWLETRERVVRSSQELRAQGWSISDRGEVIHPDCLEEPLRSEVLRQMNLPSA